MDTNAVDAAVKTLQTQGGLVTVILAEGVDAPTDWSFHPQVHWVLASQIKRDDMRAAIPSNTRLVCIGGRLDAEIYRPMQFESERRRLPYLMRNTPAAIAQTLQGIFPERKARVPDAPTTALEQFDAAHVPATPGNGNGHDPASETPPTTIAKRGVVRDFIESQAATLLHSSLSVAAEGRRLFPIAQRQGIPTTIGSLQQAIRMFRRAHSLGSRPESATPEHINDTTAVALALETAIGALTQVKVRVERMDAEADRLRKDNEDLRMRIGLMKDAFKDL